jgi:hypothetical protein
MWTPLVVVDRLKEIQSNYFQLGVRPLGLIIVLHPYLQLYTHKCNHSREILLQLPSQTLNPTSSVLLFHPTLLGSVTSISQFPSTTSPHF